MSQLPVFGALALPKFMPRIEIMIIDRVQELSLNHLGSAMVYLGQREEATRMLLATYSRALIRALMRGEGYECKSICTVLACCSTMAATGAATGSCLESGDVDRGRAWELRSPLY